MRTALAFALLAIGSCAPPAAPPTTERPRREFTAVQYQACLDYYRDYVARRRNRYCNPAHDLGFFVDGIRQDTGEPIGGDSAHPNRPT